MMCKIKSCAGLHLFKAAILCSQRNYLNDIDPPIGLEMAAGGGALSSGGAKWWHLRAWGSIGLEGGLAWSKVAELC